MKMKVTSAMMSSSSDSVKSSSTSCKISRNLNTGMNPSPSQSKILKNYFMPFLGGSLSIFPSPEGLFQFIICEVQEHVLFKKGHRLRLLYGIFCSLPSLWGLTRFLTWLPSGVLPFLFWRRRPASIFFMLKNSYFAQKPSSHNIQILKCVCQSYFQILQV